MSALRPSDAGMAALGHGGAEAAAVAGAGELVHAAAPTCAARGCSAWAAFVSRPAVRRAVLLVFSAMTAAAMMLAVALPQPVALPELFPAGDSIARYKKARPPAHPPTRPPACLRCPASARQAA